jgi:hypothetical protein
MKTDDLIRAIAQDRAVARDSIRTRIAIALMAGGSIAGLMFTLTLGFRPDLTIALHSWRFLLKLLVTLVAFATAAWVCTCLARPDAGFRDVRLAMATAPALLTAGILLEMLSVPPGFWIERLIGTNALICLVAIPLMSTASLVALLMALRQGAPRSPTVSGAAAGLLAGTMSASLYATHCPDDSPFFVLVWYCTAIAIVVLAGAAIGTRTLRW